MPSLAYARWIEFVGDPHDLLQRFQAAVSADDPGPHALSRAVIVGLAAAWETYVEHVAVEAGYWALDPPALDQLETTVRRFNNPTADHVANLIRQAIGRDPWPYVMVVGKTASETREVVNVHQRTRHQIAHGQARPRFREAMLVERIEFFRELVGNLDSFLEGELESRMGLAPW